MDKYGYIGIETLLNFCENSKDHSVTPNDFMRMKRVRMPEHKKGKWIPLQLSMAHPPYQCSCCFRNAPMVETGCLVNRHLEALLTDWCPWCGAKMKEGD